MLEKGDERIKRGTERTRAKGQGGRARKNRDGRVRERGVFPARDLRERSACTGSTYVCIPVSTAARGAFSVQPARAKSSLLLPLGPTFLRFSVWQFRSSCTTNEKWAWPEHKSLNPVQSSVSSSRFFSFLHDGSETD